MKTRTVLLGLGAFATMMACGDAHAIVGIDSPGQLLKVENPAMQGSGVALRDADDPSQYYLAYDRVYLATDDASGKPLFGFVYSEEGGKLALTVSAGFSPASIRLKDRLESDGYRVSPLQPTKGTWTIQVRPKDSDKNLIVGLYSVESVLPQARVSLVADLDRTGVYYLAHMYQTGGGVGAIYTYNFPAKRNRVNFVASINFSDVQRYIKEQTLIATNGCKQTDVGGHLKYLNFGYAGKPCKASVSNIRKITQELIEKKIVKIHRTTSSGVDATQEKAEMDSVMSLLMKMTFQPFGDATSRLPDVQPPTSNQCTPPAAPTNPGTGGQPTTGSDEPPLWHLGVFHTECSTKAQWYVYDEEIKAKNIEHRYEIVGDSVDDYNGAVGGTLSELCVKFPLYFKNVRTGATGCPTKWDEALGLQTPTSGGPQVVQPQGNEVIASPMDLSKPVAPF